MPRPRHTLEARAPRITHLYGTSLKWTKVPRKTLLTPETALQLRAEGYTMALIRSGWRSSRSISLIRYVQRLPRAPEYP